jgi:LemA protein
MKKLVTLVVLMALLGGAGYLAVVEGIPRYDQLVAQREAVRREWAQVDTQLLRRYELIPNLLATVKGYASHEEKILLEVADAHAGYLKARTQDARLQAAYQTEKSLQSCMRYAIASYPDLKANHVFLQLMRSLENTEDQIARARMSYNQAVSELNTTTQSAIGGLVAGLSGIEEVSYYNPPSETTELPRVGFRPDTGAAPTPAQPAGAGQAGVRALSIAGFVEGARGPESAIVQFPGGSQRVVKVGDEILELRARVKLIDGAGVTFEESSLDDKGASVTQLVRVDR